MFDIYIRNVKDMVVDPIVQLLKSQTFSPNYITIASGIVGMISIFCSMQDWRYLACVIGFTGRLLDGLDGAYARLTN